VPVRALQGAPTDRPATQGAACAGARHAGEATSARHTCGACRAGTACGARSAAEDRGTRSPGEDSGAGRTGEACGTRRSREACRTRAGGAVQAHAPGKEHDRFEAAEALEEATPVKRED
jgi:hypothetical protein